MNPEGTNLRVPIFISLAPGTTMKGIEFPRLWRSPWNLCGPIEICAFASEGVMISLERPGRILAVWCVDVFIVWCVHSIPSGVITGCVWDHYGPWEIWMKIKISDFQGKISDWWLGHPVSSCPHMNGNGPYRWKVNTGSGNGLVASGNKLLPEPMLIQIYIAIWHH